ncbi:gamma-glutamyl-gamma-aminobutyrate hydrolase family protein [Streptomyces sp. NBC_00525]|uniref:gamma-glutamyl-gamma-aminobutyrate hydrolase family protein n=1 Tax=Streptomyces sp. NBC_00525 TaxID=2903660 RepID=UPI002E7FCD2F|nr:gamma-glutamyl-gamma-aminobutyrate hydrolase family protein [Streptomyces sp. NBC_00525]WUC96835.1 gamma-glutamyl-gamma-aminobutyrate hydrolase family protein [Streptomyces sp. NBC_00525]
MTGPARPLIAIPARFSTGATALRHAAEVNARALVEAVWRAGGEPATIHPYAPGGRADPADTAARLARFDGLLLPGGGDLAPHRYGAGHAHASVYDVDDEQDAFDLEAARQASALGLPLLAICRGLQVVNTALNGTLHQDMGGPGRDHRHVRHPVHLTPGSTTARVTGTDRIEASCYHHQHIDRLGTGLTVTARATDGTVEAIEAPDTPGWFLAVQWHPEDTAATDPTQQAIFNALITAARAHRFV